MTPTQIASGSTLLDLPAELLVVIVEDLLVTLHERCVLALALSCRSLCYFILPMVLKDVQDLRQLSSQILGFHNHQTMIALPILLRIPSLLCLKGVRIDFASSNCFSRPWSSREIMRNIPTLRVLVERVTKVEEIWIRFPLCNNILGWNKAFADLLQALATKRCTDFTVVRHSNEGGWRSPSGYGTSIRLRRLDIGPSVASSFRSLMKRQNSDHLLELQYGLRDPAIIRPISGLTTFVVDSSLFMCSPFLDWTLRSLHLSSNSITTLHLSHIVYGTEWGHVLPCITLLALTDFKVVSTPLEVVHLMRFISRHSTIEILHFDSSDTPHSMPIYRRIGKPVPNLTKLSGHTNFVHFLLGSDDGAPQRFPHLQTFEILSPVQLWGTFGNADGVLRSLAPFCQDRRISLSLTVTDRGDSLSWLENHCTERLLLVDHLLLQRHDFGFHWDSTLDRFPRWFGFLPALRQVSFHPNMLESRNIVGFLKRISEACPLLETVTVGPITKSVEAWLASTDESKQNFAIGGDVPIS